MSTDWFIPQSRDRDLGGFAERFQSVNGKLAWSLEQEEHRPWRVGVAVGLAIAGLVTWRVLAG